MVWITHFFLHVVALVVTIATITEPVLGETHFEGGKQRQALADVVDVRTTGAVCDGQSHPLATKFSNLAEAQRVYPFISSLGQELDYAGIQLATYHALGWPGREHGPNASANRPIVVPPGECLLGNDTWTIRNAVSAIIRGAGRLASKVKSNATVLAFDGLWYSIIENIAFNSTSPTAVVALDIDGNVPNHLYATRGVQGNTLRDVLVGGGGSTFALALCRQGKGGGQCSENQYYNLHLSNASMAVYFQNGFNAIDNNWFGGDCQNYRKHCIYLVAGSIGVFKVSFESTTGYNQIENDGYDIDASSAGAYDTITVYGSRTESMRFYRGAWSQSADLRAISQRVAGFGNWQPKVALKNNYLVSKRGTDGRPHAYRVTTAGTTGDREPIWPTSGSIHDGTVEWTLLNYTAVQVVAGTVDLTTSTFDPTASIDAPTPQYLPFKEVKADYRTGTGDELILATPSDGNISISLSDEVTMGANLMVHQITVKRSIASTNNVTIRGVFGGEIILPAGTLDAATFVHATANNRAPAWYLINYTAATAH